MEYSDGALNLDVIEVEMVYVHIIVTLPIVLLQKKRSCGVTLPGVTLQRWKGDKVGVAPVLGRFLRKFRLILIDNKANRIVHI